MKERQTKETSIKLALSQKDETLEAAPTTINTGVGFLDHMLTLFAFHACLNLYVEAKGDTWVDDHHTTEDIDILLGEAIRDLYTSLPSYERYGFYFLPMDETLSRVVLDLSGRPVFFYAVAMNSRMTLHIDLLKNGNTHHEIEGIFKGFARALAIAMAPTEGGVPSTKGLIQ